MLFPTGHPAKRARKDPSIVRDFRPAPLYAVPVYSGCRLDEHTAAVGLSSL